MNSTSSLKLFGSLLSKSAMSTRTTPVGLSLSNYLVELPSELVELIVSAENINLDESKKNTTSEERYLASYTDGFNCSSKSPHLSLRVERNHLIIRGPL